MRESLGGRRGAIVFAALLIAVSAVYFRDIWPNWNEQTYADDNVSMWVPAAAFEMQELRNRRLPLWNPYAQAGTPWIASPIAHFVFYPFTWLNWVGRLTSGIHLFVVFHLAMAGWGMWVLSKRLGVNSAGRFASSAFYVICGGYVFTVMSGYVAMIAGLCWTPFLIVVLMEAAESSSKARAMGWTGIAAALMAFQMFVMVTYALTLAFFPAAIAQVFLVHRRGKAPVRKAVAVLVFAGILASLWSMPKLISLLAFSEYGTRDAHLSNLAHSVMGSCHPIYFLNLLFPGVVDAVRDPFVQGGRVPIYSLFVFPAVAWAIGYRPMSETSALGASETLTRPVSETSALGASETLTRPMSETSALGASETLTRPMSAGVGSESETPTLEASETLTRPMSAEVGLILAGTFLLFLPGLYSPFYLLLCSLPVVSANSHPNLFMYPIGLGLALLIGNLAQEISEPRPEVLMKGAIVRRGAAVLGVIAAISLAGAFFFPTESRITAYFLENKDAFTAPAAIKRVIGELSDVRQLGADGRRGIAKLIESIRPIPLVLSAAVWLAIFFACMSKTSGRRICAALACLALFLADIHLNQPRELGLVRLEEFHRPSPAVDYLKKQSAAGEIFRVFPSGNGYDQPYFRFNRGMLERIESVKGETVYQLRHYAEYMNRLDGSNKRIPVYAQLFGRIPYRPSRLLDLLNARYVISDDPKMDTAGLTLVVPGPCALYRNENALPRAYLSAAMEVVDPREMWDRISDAGYDPREKVFVAGVPPGGFPFLSTHNLTAAVHDEDMTIRWTRRNADELELTVQCRKDAYLVLSEVDCPGWTAQVDGVETPIFRVNHMFRAVAMPGGLHTARFVFRPPQLRAGLWIAGLSGLAYALGLLACVLGTRRI